MHREQEANASELQKQDTVSKTGADNNLLSQELANFANLIKPRKNNRKRTRGRYTQVITVPKYLVKKGLSKDANFIALLFKEFATDASKASRPDLFKLNPSKHAGLTKVIYHKPTQK